MEFSRICTEKKNFKIIIKASFPEHICWLSYFCHCYKEGTGKLGDRFYGENQNDAAALHFKTPGFSFSSNATFLLHSLSQDGDDGKTQSPSCLINYETQKLLEIL